MPLRAVTAPEPLDDVFTAQDFGGGCRGHRKRGRLNLAHLNLPRVRSRAKWMLKTMAMRIAAPMMMLKVKALMPSMVNPALQHAQHQAAEETADDRARPAHQRRAADNRRSNGQEHHG